MPELFCNNGHLTDEGLQALLAGTLDELQRLEAAEHLSFCDECLLRYTQLLEEPQLMEPSTPQVLPVMRRLLGRKVRTQVQRYAAAVAAVAITGAFWYSGVFTGALDTLQKSSNPLPHTSQSQQVPDKKPGWLERLGPQHHPDTQQKQNRQPDLQGWLEQLFERDDSIKE